MLLDNIKNNDVHEIQTSFRKFLETKLSEQKENLKESTILAESDACLKLQLAVREHAGTNFECENGVAAADFTSKRSAELFSDWLDESDIIDDYEMFLLNDENTEELDFDEIPEENSNIEFVMYLTPDKSSFVEEIEVQEDPIDESELDEETLLEFQRLRKVNFKGEKRIKIKCPKGYIWDRTLRTCTKISSKRLASLRRSIRKSIMTKKSEGSSLKRRQLFRTRRALKFRKNYGI